MERKGFKLNIATHFMKEICDLWQDATNFPNKFITFTYIRDKYLLSVVLNPFFFLTQSL